MGYIKEYFEYPMDIERKKIQCEQELAKIRQEFADVLYIVSHDLNAPLRYIREFSKLFKKRIEHRLGVDTLTDDEQLFANLLEQNVTRLESLLDGLLQYSRLNTEIIPLEIIDCTDIINELIHKRNTQFSTANVQIEYKELPKINAKKPYIKNLFFHLIDNAIKFNKNSCPKLSIQAHESGDKYQFSVADNGIGIDLKFHQDVFHIFRQLHQQDEYPGIGMGLALAKKIVEHHGGQIWIEANENAGCTVLFTLPHTEIDKRS